MLLDIQTLLCDDMALGNVGTNVSTNSIDLGAAGTVPAMFQAPGTPPHDIGRAPGTELMIQMSETAAGATATCDFQLIISDNANLSSPTVIQTTGAIAMATLVAGYKPRLQLPVGITKRYLGLQCVVATANFTAGKVTAGLVPAGASQNTFIG